MENPVYHYERRLEYALNGVEKSDLPKTNKKAIVNFCTDSLAEGLSKARVSKYAILLKTLASWLDKEFESASEDDIRAVVLNVEKSHCVDHTKKEMRMLLKRLYKWLRKSEDFPPEVSWIKLRYKSAAKLKLPEEILTEDEVHSMVRAAGNPRDRAMVAVLYESGCRIPTG
jgi:site-specific recombinase XerD